MADLVVLGMLRPAWFVLLFALFLFFLHYYWFTVNGKTGQMQQRESRRLPSSPPALPIIGHLHLVGSLPHVSLRALAARHGRDGLMLLRLGAVPTLIVSSPSAAEAVLRTHDQVFASRPYSVASDIILYGSSEVAFGPYGEQWRKAKKLLTNHVLSVRKVQSFRSVVMEEVNMVLAKINEAATIGGVVDMSELLNSFTYDLACRIVSGEFFLQGSNKWFQDLTKETSRLLGGFNMQEFFPILTRVGLLKRTVRAKSERVRNRWDDLLDKVIDDHESKYGSKFEHKGGNFVDILLSVQMEYGLTREHIKALLIDVFFGSTDTSSNSLDFTLAELMRKPRLIGKLQDEVRSIVPRGQTIVSEADMNKMTYLRAVIKESLRLHPIAPLLAPHFAMDDCIIDGQMVPAGTHVFVNVWAIGRDSSYWEDAEEFIPERFIHDGSDVNVNYKGNDFKLLSFGAGRRICPGINLGIVTVELMLANLMYHFDWELPLGVARKDIDMTEVFGLTVRRKENLLLVPKSRR